MAIDQSFLIGPADSVRMSAHEGIQAQEIVPCASMSHDPLCEVS